MYKLANTHTKFNKFNTHTHTTGEEVRYCFACGNCFHPVFMD